jgi:hypothetical protein
MNCSNGHINFWVAHVRPLLANVVISLLRHQPRGAPFKPSFGLSGVFDFDLLLITDY